ncbi:MAG: hypothetical protein KAU28_09595, partial [Phycisphaerae bacterium]|nr:hypothetical protein [Phycisphaerae bacterium]
MMVLWAGIIAVAISFIFSVLATPVSKRFAHRLGMLDVPDRRKTHGRAVPLLGGSAIFAAILAPSLLAMAVARVWAAMGIPPWLPRQIAEHIPGLAAKTPMALGILAGAFVLHVVGLIDDRRKLGAALKLIAQLAVATAV